MEIYVHPTCCGRCGRATLRIPDKRFKPAFIIELQGGHQVLTTWLLDNQVGLSPCVTAVA